MGKLINIGNTNLDKGKVRDDMVLKAWDSVTDCNGEECPLHGKCNHLKAGKCSVQLAYINNLCDNVLVTYKHMDKVALFKFGMHLLPLYSYLCKMKIVEAGIRDMVNITPKGMVQIHPIYKEIRETLKTILTVGRDIELFINGVPADPGIDFGDESNGSKEHYKRISEMTERRGVR